jgi:glycosyltransferase involved in cell wall biosynthesis
MKSCLVAIAKNECHFVFEWILYHALGGFDTVVVYDNSSTDNTVAEIRRAAQHVDARVVDWPLHPGQCEAYNNAVHTLGDEFDVFAMLDLDEFLVPTGAPDIRAVLARTYDHPFIAVNWMIFGANGHETRPTGLVTENYTRRSVAANNHVKTLMRPGDHSACFANPHCLAEVEYADLTGQRIHWNSKRGKTSEPVGTEIAVIHHYLTKSREDYMAKIGRGRATIKQVRLDKFDEHIKRENAIEDRTIPEHFGTILEQIKDANNAQYKGV